MTAPQSRFISLRWRLLLPPFIVILILTMASVYIIARSLPSSAEMSRVNILLAAQRDASERASDASQFLDAGNIDAAVAALRGSSIADILIYEGDQVVGTTLANALVTDVTPGDDPNIWTIDIDGSLYLASDVPLANDAYRAVVLLPERAPFAVEAAQQLIGLTLATVAGGIIIAVFVISSLVLERLNQIREVAESLAAGNLDARTGMKATDEIGAVGRALDAYADKVRERHDSLRVSLRRQRREIAHLNAVLESLPDGVIVQDLDGNVTFMNDHAKALLRTPQALADTQAATAHITDVLGTAIAPGLYTIGAPRRIEAEGRTLSAQAVAVLSLAEQRVGTVIIVRDITEEARRERAREALLNQLATEIQRPLAEAADRGERAFAREISRHAAALQKLIVEMRELNAEIDAEAVKTVQRPLPLETLIWAVVNEWRPVAQAANIELGALIERPGLYILGDERRLRWAIGNIVDNAIKYTLPGGAVSIEIKGDEDGQARMRVRDNGVGITADELPHVFARFYRGNPVAKNGRSIRVPGSGQGLTIAKSIIEAHGGQIFIRSTPGIGTAVYFTLPLTEPVSTTVPELPLLDEDDAENETIRLNDERK